MSIGTIVRAGLALLIAFAATTPASAEDKADLVTGYWLTQEKDGIIQVYKGESGSIEGKIVGGSGPPRKDVNNPDPAERDKWLRGKVIARGFRYDGQAYWAGGTIYDPNNGSTYKCRMKLNADGNLEVRGYIGVPILGRTAVWTRTKAPEERPEGR